MRHVTIYVQNQPDENHRSYMALEHMPHDDERREYVQTEVVRYRGACIWVLVKGTAIAEQQAAYLAHTLLDNGPNWQMIDLSQFDIGPLKVRAKART